MIKYSTIQHENVTTPMKSKMITSVSTKIAIWLTSTKYKSDKYNRKADRINRKHKEKSHQNRLGTVSEEITGGLE